MNEGHGRRRGVGHPPRRTGDIASVGEQIEGHVVVDVEPVTLRQLSHRLGQPDAGYIVGDHMQIETGTPEIAREFQREVIGDTASAISEIEKRESAGVTECRGRPPRCGSKHDRLGRQYRDGGSHVISITAVTEVVYRPLTQRLLPLGRRVPEGPA
jgi:hypothetical protein